MPDTLDQKLLDVCTASNVRDEAAVALDAARDNLKNMTSEHVVPCAMAATAAQERLTDAQRQLDAAVAELVRASKGILR